MRKLKLQLQTSIDGFIGGPNGEMDWMVWDWDDQLKKYVSELLDSIDCILLGRKLAEGFIPHWTGVASDPKNLEVEAGKIFTQLPKVVFTRTLDHSPWDNTTLAKGDLTEEVKAIKEQEGRDLYACGGAEFVSNLIGENLIDEYYLFVNPSAIGNGMSVFRQRTGLQFAAARSFPCGITVLKYESK